MFSEIASFAPNSFCFQASLEIVLVTYLIIVLGSLHELVYKITASEKCSEIHIRTESNM
jgi:hypothetical protein